VLRAEMGLNRIYAQLVESINLAIGFRVSALNIVRSDSEYLEVVATSGLSAANQRELATHPPHLPALVAAMRPEFCRSRSYFIPHQYRHVLDAVSVVEPGPHLPQGAVPNAWHPEDALLVPLISPRHGRLLGVLSLDQPEDGLIPSIETIEIIELFANQAALAIDTSRLFAEREHERQMLAQGLQRLRYHLDLARNRDLRLPAPPLNSVLDPLVISFNEVLNTFNDLLADAQAASEMVNQHASEVRDAATYLSEGSADQAHRILDLSTVVNSMAHNIRHIAATASQSSSAAHEASALSRAGSEHTAIASEGMARVRELTLQTKKKVKRLGESAQEIGDIVQMVEDIAAQTNLLALNASIEAARAGEHGRGFAVVAQEIRRLATSATEATRQIHSRIEGVQNETKQVVVQIEHGVELVVMQSETVTQAGAALAEVEQLNQRLVIDVQQINDIASEQAQAATQVAQVITDLAGVSTQTSDSMQQTRASMDYLVELASALQQQISVFQLRQPTRPQSPATAPLAATSPRLPTPQIAPQKAPVMGQLLTPAVSPTTHPIRSGDAAEPATQPMSSLSATRFPSAPLPSVRALLQDTMIAPSVSSSGAMPTATPTPGQSDWNSRTYPSLGSGPLRDAGSVGSDRLTPSAEPGATAESETVNAEKVSAEKVSE
jgi:methyl-accepting chemotaxis protein